MQRASGSQKTQEFLSTHPGHETRIKRLTEHMPEALALYERTDKAMVAALPAVGGHTASASLFQP
jgi:hypothetical protein